MRVSSDCSCDFSLRSLQNAELACHIYFVLFPYVLSMTREKRVIVVGEPCIIIVALLYGAVALYVCAEYS